MEPSEWVKYWDKWKYTSISGYEIKCPKCYKKFDARYNISCPGCGLYYDGHWVEITKPIAHCKKTGGTYKLHPPNYEWKECPHCKAEFIGGRHAPRMRFCWWFRKTILGKK